MGRAPCCDKSNVKKGPWSPQEDAKLKSYIHNHGTGGNWIALPQKIGLKRCGKSCRLRWLNYLRPNLKHGGFTEDEDNLICSLYVSIGSRWSIIATQLPGRTDNDIKNYWNTRLKKKLLSKHRRTEQPPPLLAEYANQQNYWLQTNINLSMPPKFETELISYDHTDHQLYNYSDHRVYCGTDQSDFCSFNGLADFNFSAFDDHNIPQERTYSTLPLQFGGVDSFSDPVEMCNSSSSMVCSESSTSWGDLGSTIYPSDLQINYQVCHEKMQQDLALFDEPRLLAGYYSK